MMPQTEYLDKYARLLVNYCVSLQPGERLFVNSTTLAEPLIDALYRETLKAGGNLEVSLTTRGQAAAMREYGSPEQFAYLPTLQKRAMDEFEAYIYVSAPFDLREPDPSPELKAARREAFKPMHDTYFARTADRRLKRSMCIYPTPALAEEAGMSEKEYTAFVFNACKLNEADPKAAWLGVRDRQQRVVDHLNSCTSFRYLNDRSDIHFTTNGRTWINSDGQTNMPSGEVYTSPEEDSVNGHIYFDYPAIRNGVEVKGVSLEVKDGEIQSWRAESGQEVLDETFAIDGTRRFGEAAIGTNYDIDRFSKQILFDEKIGGTVHMAVGQSYAQAGGRNSSSVHWDMIANMRAGGRVFADGEIIYENGRFVDRLWK
ncbi:aminopeptidase [Neolewinella xylanilytica]|uniref:Aminopeptidase n=1 Tax=Neolewinella xylanilytica TaxID=1514080 RepID=A0A2S6I7E5_9BACT|nr:aminopeptidase [Neolewinella xylanilytica]PPK87349.1 aminopeptidase [Neolewinella xylanilytica]